MNNKGQVNGALPIGTILRSAKHEYRVEEILGMGGFGITYKASAKVMVQIGNVSQEVVASFAIKEFFIRGCDRDENGATVTFAATLEGDIKQSLRDFMTEAKRLNVLGTKSKNIVKVNEVFEANDTAYYVMEYIDGGNVASYVAKHGTLSWDNAKKIIIPIAQAVRLLHKEKLLHMDIKPDNIMLKRNNEGKLFPVLIDFGIAKHFDSKGRPTSHLMAKGASDGYAPMEQYTGIDTFAPEIDVYALGATIFYLLTAQTPPKADKIRSANSLKTLLPATLNDLQKESLTAAMNPNRYERIPNASAFIESLSNSRKVEVSSDIATEMIKTDQGGEDKKTFIYGGIAVTVIAIGLAILLIGNTGGKTKEALANNDTIKVDSVKRDTIVMTTTPIHISEEESTTVTSMQSTPTPSKHKKGDTELWASQVSTSYNHSNAQSTQTETNATENLSAEEMGKIGFENYQEQNYTQAVYWYRKAAELGHVGAQINLGYCYKRGLGVKKDYTQAVYWYRKAAEQGNAKAQANLGNCYYDGLGVTQDYEQAAYWYRKAAAQGDEYAKEALQHMPHEY